MRTINANTLSRLAAIRAKPRAATLEREAGQPKLLPVRGTFERFAGAANCIQAIRVKRNRLPQKRYKVSA